MRHLPSASRGFYSTLHLISEHSPLRRPAWPPERQRPLFCPPLTVAHCCAPCSLRLALFRFNQSAWSVRQTRWQVGRNPALAAARDPAGAPVPDDVPTPTATRPAAIRLAGPVCSLKLAEREASDQVHVEGYGPRIELDKHCLEGAPLYQPVVVDSS